MAKSESIGKLAEALAKVQMAITGAAKSSTNPHFKSKYADLTAVWDACRDELSAHGLCVVQTNEPCERGILLRTTLMHTSGEWIDGLLEIPAEKQNAQGYGSALTYARRYALAAIVGITQSDDDGHEASKPVEKTAPIKPAPASEPPKEELSREDKTRLRDLALEVIAMIKVDEKSAYMLFKDANLDKPGRIFLNTLFDDTMRAALTRAKTQLDAERE